MSSHIRIAAVLLALGLGLSLPVLALDLNQASAALGQAKASGQVGEKPNGHLRAIAPGGQTAEIARLINEARRTDYQHVAQKNAIHLGDPQALAAKKAITKPRSLIHT